MRNARAWSVFDTRGGVTIFDYVSTTIEAEPPAEAQAEAQPDIGALAVLAATMVLSSEVWTSAEEWDEDGDGDGLICCQCGHASVCYDGFFTFQDGDQICDLCPDCVISRDWTDMRGNPDIYTEMNNWAADVSVNMF